MNSKEKYIASVIIPVFNGLKTLPLQIKALEKQKTSSLFEILIADNGSTDGLKEWLQNEKNHHLRYIDASEVKGAAYARNKAVREARSEYILFCDADDLVDKFWVSNAVKALTKYPIVTGTALTVFEDEFSAIKKPEDGWKKFANLSSDDVYSEAPMGSIAPIILGGNFAIHKSLFEEIGGFDVYFKSGSEDNDLSYRVKKVGVSLIEVKNMKILYRIRQDWGKLFLRGYRTGITFSQLAYKHDVWDSAIPYESLTVFSIPKSFVKFVVNYRPSDVEGNISRLSTVFTVVGLLLGKFKYKYLKFPISFMEGVGYEKR